MLLPATLTVQRRAIGSLTHWHASPPGWDGVQLREAVRASVVDLVRDAETDHVGVAETEMEPLRVTEDWDRVPVVVGESELPAGSRSMCLSAATKP